MAQTMSFIASKIFTIVLQWLKFLISGWMDGVKVALGNRGMKVEAERKIGKSGEPWYICN